MFVAATKLDENVVRAVGDHEPLLRELQQGCLVGVPVEGAHRSAGSAHRARSCSSLSGIFPPFRMETARSEPSC